jgi:hypothetical protein
MAAMLVCLKVVTGELEGAEWSMSSAPGVWGIVIVSSRPQLTPKCLL